MNYSEVKELLQAGFTAEEIRGMLITPTDNPQNPQDNPQPEKQPEPKKPEKQPEPQDPEKQPEPVKPEQNPDEAKFNQLNDTMEKLIKTIQSSNLNNNSFDSILKTDLNTEVDKIMAGIIRPERDKQEV